MAKDKKPKKTGKGEKPPKGAERASPPKLTKELYEDELERLQAELVKLQLWVQDTGHRAVVVFEGRDAAGKGGVIKRITERVSPRVFRVVALPAPTEREKGQLYFQRYIQQFPAKGEIVLFDRSWYNRAGVERVMGFCTDEEYMRFLQDTPRFEQWIVEGGVTLVKYWFHIRQETQEERFRDRIEDPRKVWKLSPMDVASYDRWYEYSHARDAMLMATDRELTPWNIVRADSKRRARLNCIAHLLSQFDYEAPTREPARLGKRDTSGAYDDIAPLQVRKFVPERF